jgi:predicted membrane-bound dolichyl-phosphate-mannose-protein mannosyltransferase
VDRAIRTIKDGVGLDKKQLLNASIILNLVEYYNNTPLRAFFNKFTLSEVENDIELESWYIRQQDSKLIDVLKKQNNASLHKYKKGNVLLIHLPNEKTNQRFQKRRRNFDQLAIFVQYVNGNCQVELVKNNNKTEIIPIYYTQFLCDSLYTLPERYFRVFLSSL